MCAFETFGVSSRIDVKPTLRSAAADAVATGIADTYAEAMAFHSAAMAFRVTTRSACL
jgi:hypothetical protein